MGFVDEVDELSSEMRTLEKQLVLPNVLEPLESRVHLIVDRRLGPALLEEEGLDSLSVVREVHAEAKQDDGGVAKPELCDRLTFRDTSMACHDMQRSDENTELTIAKGLGGEP